MMIAEEEIDRHNGRIAAAVAMGGVFASLLTWAVMRDCYIAIELVAKPHEQLVIEVTAEGYPICLVHEGIEMHMDGPPLEEMRANADLVVAYVRTMVGPVALVMARGGEGLFSIGWIPRVDATHPCWLDVELVGTELQLPPSATVTFGPVLTYEVGQQGPPLTDPK